MKRFLLTLTLIGAYSAYAYEYPLQFTPQSGARSLVVAGYEFVNNTVVGDCSYTTTSACSGRGCHVVTTSHHNTCSWDLFGNLISVTPVVTSLVAPPPLTQIGTETIYAVSGSSSTGRDSRGFGFVSTPSSHYSWQTVNGGYAVIPYALYTTTATLISDGDLPLTLAGATITPAVSGSITPLPGTATISASTCPASVPVGTSCSLTITYNPKTIKCTPSPYGYAYTKIDLSLITDAGANTDFTMGFTITGIPICDD